MDRKTTVRDEAALGGLRTAETEIDLLCIDRDAKNYMVGECKFKKAPFSYSEYLDTTAKLMVLFFLSDPNPLRWALSRFLLCPQN